ncbi:pentapeptide repeat-containing protein [Amycolatopsis sp. CA-126428]|uniref:pentapeptide repeat-containing protein n=1 Tax=Amycolatopsis sp. CA-126428 TaxID=2073158 RepID=UPI000CD3081D|nr:pentapeptide repeat-containing protein [Amycolatopsis sp. CA-126428]
MSTVTPLAILALIGAVSGSVTAWLLLRRDRPAEVLIPSAPPEPVPGEVAARLVADERAARLAALASFARQADADPDLRQECVGEILTQFRSGRPDPPAWQAELWRLLLPHLRPGSPWFWPGMDLELDGLVLHAVDLRGCEVRDARFHAVRFVGDARFGEAVFTGLVSFEGSCFARHALFGSTRFGTGADFEDATFTGTADFTGVTAGGPMWFDAARFSARTDFPAAAFGDDVSFEATGFAGRTLFSGSRFAAGAHFTRARFGGHADFTAATAGGFDFTGAQVRLNARVLRTWPPGWAPGEPEPRRWAGLTRL